MQFPGSITESQADAIVSAMFKWMVDMIDGPRSLVAAVICDAVSADITLQPLHNAYGRRAAQHRAAEAERL